MIVGDALAPFVHRSPEDGVGEGVAGALYLAGPEDEVMGELGSHNGVQHDGQIAAGGVLHAHRHIAAAGHQAVELVLHGTCALYS